MHHSTTEGGNVYHSTQSPKEEMCTTLPSPVPEQGMCTTVPNPLNQKEGICTTVPTPESEVGNVQCVPPYWIPYQREGMCTTIPTPVPEGGNVCHSTYSCTRRRECVPQYLLFYQKEGMYHSSVPNSVPEGGNMHHNTLSCIRRRKCVPQYLVLYQKQGMCTTVLDPVPEGGGKPYQTFPLPPPPSPRSSAILSILLQQLSGLVSGQYRVPAAVYTLCMYSSGSKPVCCTSCLPQLLQPIGQHRLLRYRILFKTSDLKNLKYMPSSF